MSSILKMNSAEVDQGDTRLNITPVTCKVNPDNDEDVTYTPAGAGASVLIHANATIQVLTTDNKLKTVDGAWLVNNQLVNTPYFYYQENAQQQITAMQEIYHP